jgi:hypothetical protein
MLDAPTKNDLNLARDSASKLGYVALRLSDQAEQRDLSNILKNVSYLTKGVKASRREPAGREPAGREPAGRVASERMCVTVIDALLADTDGWQIDDGLWWQLTFMAGLADTTLELTRKAAERQEPAV